MTHGHASMMMLTGGDILMLGKVTLHALIMLWLVLMLSCMHASTSICIYTLYINPCKLSHLPERTAHQHFHVNLLA
jgi:hypothetical protein